MSGGLEFSSYQINQHGELCLRAGRKHSQQILLVPPLFDEMNRLRHLLVKVMHQLDDFGIGSSLIDLPATNESLFPPAQASLSLWSAAVAQCAAQFGLSKIASFRGGCLAVASLQSASHWHLAPIDGDQLLRRMLRSRVAADKEAGINTSIAALSKSAEHDVINLAGNLISPALFTELSAATLVQLPDQHIVRLIDDNKPCDSHIAGSPLWLRSEPGDDPILSAAISGDLAGWARS